MSARVFILKSFKIVFRIKRDYWRMFVVPDENSSIEGPYEFPLQTLFFFIYITK